MTFVSLTEINARVREIIDEIGVNDSEFIDGSDTVRLDQIIRGKVEEGVRYIHNTAPVSLLDGKAMPTEGLTITEDLWGYFALPSDFMRLVSFQMNEWKLPAYGVVYEGSREYTEQKDVYARGSYEDPICAVVLNNSGGKNFEFYSCQTIDAKPSISLYLPWAKIETKNNIEGIEICDKLVEAAMYQIAGLVLVTYMSQHADNLFTLVKTIIG